MEFILKFALPCQKKNLAEWIHVVRTGCDNEILQCRQATCHRALERRTEREVWITLHAWDASVSVSFASGRSYCAHSTSRALVICLHSLYLDKTLEWNKASGEEFISPDMLEDYCRCWPLILAGWLSFTDFFLSLMHSARFTKCLQCARHCTEHLGWGPEQSGHGLTLCGLSVGYSYLPIWSYMDVSSEECFSIFGRIFMFP